MSSDNKKKQIKAQIQQLLKEYYQIPEPSFDSETGRIALSSPTYNGEDVAEAVDSILKGWPTIGPKVRQVEDKIASLIGVKNTIMVNSGSSANFLILYLLSSSYVRPEHRLYPGDEIITPAVTWITTASPIIQIGCVPVFVDVNLETYDINVEQIRKNITKKTRALLIVHPMGCACEMDKIVEICKKHDLLLIEDACESLGARYRDQHVGTFGEFGTFSFYFSHHITSVEGGIIVVRDDAYADAFRCMRANGCFREIRDQKLKEKLIAENPHLDTAFMFPFIGFNLKPTDVAAGLVLHQIDQLEDFIQQRTSIARRLTQGLQKYSDRLYLPRGHKLSRHSWFTYPVVLKDDTPYSKKEFTEFLKEKRIDTRSIIISNITYQPFLKDYRFKSGELPNSDLVMRNGFFLGIHHKMDDKQIEYIWAAFEEFFCQRI